MSSIGVTTPEKMRMILDVVNYLRESGFVIPAGRGSQQTIPPPTPIYFRNDSGETVPAFACMQVTGTVEAGGQNYVTIDKPADTTGTAGWYLFNGQAPVEDGEYGIGHDGPLVRMLTDGSAVTCGGRWRPTVSSWEVQDGGGFFSAVGEDDIETNVMRAFSCMPGITNLRLSGNDLQYTVDGVTWTTWHTATECV